MQKTHKDYPVFKKLNIITGLKQSMLALGFVGTPVVISQKFDSIDTFLLIGIFAIFLLIFMIVVMRPPLQKPILPLAILLGLFVSFLSPFYLIFITCLLIAHIVWILLKNIYVKKTGYLLGTSIGTVGELDYSDQDLKDLKEYKLKDINLKKYSRKEFLSVAETLAYCLCVGSVLLFLLFIINQQINLQQLLNS